MRFASLGSGSEGNGLVVEAGSTRILIDCGFGVRDCAARLARLGIEPASINAIFVTHEHSDHVTMRWWSATSRSRRSRCRTTRASRCSSSSATARTASAC
jgi:phosphoribosyl 1,2-cyclic phosphodiesterase